MKFYPPPGNIPYDHARHVCRCLSGKANSTGSGETETVPLKKEQTL